MAQMLWSAARAMYKEFPYPSYLEMTEQAQGDGRTGQEIVADLLDALKGGD